MRDGARSRSRWTAATSTCSPRSSPVPICSYSLSELEPRLFSFNNPLGACPRCDGLGTITFFDPKRVVALSAAVARIGRDQGLGPPQPVLLPAAAEPREALRLRHRQAVRRAARARAEVSCTAPATRRSRSPTSTERGKPMTREHAFEGVVPNLERRYRETDSRDGARGAREVSEHPALPGLRRHAAAQRGAPRQGRRRHSAIYEIQRAAAHGGAALFLDALKLAGAQGRDRRQDRASEIVQPAAVS